MAIDGIVQVKNCSAVSLVIKNSIFYAYACPLENYAAIPNLLAEYRAKQNQAKHHAYAWRFLAADQQQYQRFSDDGEPGKTAGPPIFNVLERGDIQNSLVVVSRIFGGILLGKGGLVHAYGAAAEMAVKEAGLVRLEKRLLRGLEIDYSYLNAANYWFKQHDVAVNDTQYTDKVLLQLSMGEAEELALKSFLAELLASEAELADLGLTYRKVDI